MSCRGRVSNNTNHDKEILSKKHLNLLGMLQSPGQPSKKSRRHGMCICTLIN